LVDDGNQLRGHGARAGAVLVPQASSKGLVRWRT